MSYIYIYMTLVA